MVIAMPSNFRTAKDIFVELIGAVAPEQWEAQLAKVCQGDEVLRKRVQVLLRAT